MNGMIEEKKVKIKGKMRLPWRIRLIGAAVAAVLVIVAAIVLSAVFSRPGGQTTVTEASLKEIVKTGNLSTVEYIYNSILEVKDDDAEQDEILYYVSYEGVVKSGFDFNELRFETDETDKKYVVIIPEIKVNNADVKYESMDFIFVNSKDNKEGVANEAYEKCKADLLIKAVENPAVKTMARESAEAAIEAMLIPFEKDLKNGYEFEIRFAEDQK